MKTIRELSVSSDPIQVSQTLGKIFKDILKPGELEHTWEFVQNGFDTSSKSALKNGKNLSALESEVLTFLEIAESKKWQIEMPLWCLCRTFHSPKDEIFMNEAYELHGEVEKILKNNTVSIETLGNALDILLQFQLRNKIFHNISDVIEAAVLLQNSFEETLQTLCYSTHESPLMNSKIDWIIANINLQMKKFPSFVNAKLQASYKNNQLMVNFLSADIRIFKNFFKRNFETIEQMEEFVLMLDDFKIAALTNQEWDEVLNGRVESIRLLHVNIIFTCLRKQLCQVVKMEKTNKIFEDLGLVILNLFAEQKWNLQNFQKLLPKIKTLKDVKIFISLLNLVYEYDISFEKWNFDNFPQNPETWLKHGTLLTTQIAHNKVKNDLHFIKLHADQCPELTIPQIIEMIVNSIDDKTHFNSQTLLATYNEYLNEYNDLTNKIHSLSELRQKITTFRTIEIKSTHFLSKKYARIASAVYAINEYFRVRLRPVQILTILLAMDARNRNIGQLFQVQTGEGKTLIVAAIAICEAINGVKVDIVTSSTELAITQYEKLKSFYEALNLKVQHNANGNATNLISNINQKELLIKRLKHINDTGKDPGSIYQHVDEVYEADVLYGDVEDYLADLLQTEFMDQNIRLERNFELVIVDEVDSMMIDGRNDSVRLSTKTPGMNDILQVYTAIWSQIRNIHSQTKQIDGTWYYFDGEELQGFSKSQTVETFAKNASTSHLRKMLRFDDLSPEEENSDPNWDENIYENTTNVKPEYPKLEIPEYMRTYVEIQLPKWIDSAINAMFNMRCGFDYVLKNGQVVVVDASNTGVHHPSMRWSDGLHQFLQMKHGCYLEPEALATNYMSKVSLFLRYKKNILGFTGTIGGESSRKFLKSVYNVNFVDIPPFKERRHYELVPYLCASEKQWINEIATSTASKLKNNRAVLIITNYIFYAEQIASKIQLEHGCNVVLYTDRNGNSAIEKEIKPGQCIVATNIAGRGTDLLTSKEVEETGGLHVFLTFLPENDRIERQNIGRTSRTGNKGTSQFIINLSDLSTNILLPFIDKKDSRGSSRKNIFSTLREIRNSVSMEAVDTAIEDVKITKARDETFKEYMVIRKNILNHVTDYPDSSKNSLDTMFAKYLRTSREINIDTLKNEFSQFENSILVISNPYDLVRSALESFGMQKTAGNSVAVNYLTKALKCDSKFCASAYYYLGASAIDDYKKNTKNTVAIDKAIDYFLKAQNSLELKKMHIESMIQVTIPENNNTTETNTNIQKTALHSQLERQITLITALIHNIESLVGRNVDADLKYLSAMLQQNPISSEERDMLQKQKDEIQRNKKSIENGILKPLKFSKADIKVEGLPLEKVLPPSERQDLYLKEFEQFKEDQFKHIVIVNEKLPRNWWAISVIAGAALLQIVGGASAAIFSIGLGAIIGWALLQEGVCDMILAVKNGIMDRNLTWASYGIRKAISLTITMASFGFGAIKSAAKGILTGVKGIGKLLTGTATRVTNEGLKLACKAVGRTVALEVSKVALSSTIDFVCAGTIDKGISFMVKNEINKLFVQHMGQDGNLQTLLKCDEKQGNLKYSAMFSQRVLGRLNNNPDFIQQVQQETMNIINKIGEVGGSEAKFCSKIVQGFDVATIITKFKRFCQSLPNDLANIVTENSIDINEILNRDKAANEDPNLVNERTQTLSIREFFNDLSNQISNVIASQISGIAKQAAVMKISKSINKWATSVQDDIGKYRESFIDSEIILESAEIKRKDIKSQEGHETVNYIENIAIDGPGDLRQAEYISDVVEQPILIRTTNESGEEQIIRIGSEYYGKEAIELRYERPANESSIGHYTLADGTPISASGKNSCLFDAISKKTGYEPDLLRRGIANVMLSRFENVESDLQHRKFSDLFVGGKAKKTKAYRRPLRTRSPSATRYSTGINSHEMPSGNSRVEAVHKNYQNIFPNPLFPREVTYDATNNINKPYPYDPKIFPCTPPS